MPKDWGDSNERARFLPLAVNSGVRHCVILRIRVLWSNIINRMTVCGTVYLYSYMDPRNANLSRARTENTCHITICYQGVQ